MRSETFQSFWKFWLGLVLKVFVFVNVKNARILIMGITKADILDAKNKIQRQIEFPRWKASLTDFESVFRGWKDWEQIVLIWFFPN